MWTGCFSHVGVVDHVATEALFSRQGSLSHKDKTRLSPRGRHRLMGCYTNPPDLGPEVCIPSSGFLDERGILPLALADDQGLNGESAADRTS